MANVQASRRGKRHIGAYIEPESAEALKLIAFARGLTVQDIIRQSIQGWLKEQSLPPLDELIRSREVTKMLKRLGRDDLASTTAPSRKSAQ